MSSLCDEQEVVTVLISRRRFIGTGAVAALVGSFKLRRAPAEQLSLVIDARGGNDALSQLQSQLAAESSHHLTILVDCPTMNAHSSSLAKMRAAGHQLLHAPCGPYWTAELGEWSVLKLVEAERAEPFAGRMIGYVGRALPTGLARAAAEHGLLVAQWAAPASSISSGDLVHGATLVLPVGTGLDGLLAELSRRQITSVTLEALVAGHFHRPGLLPVAPAIA